ncbi:ANK1 [Symbiodinium sp. KB8]|nr:ANK1 [Symbiodinium sp. KB8]
MFRVLGLSGENVLRLDLEVRKTPEAFGYSHVYCSAACSGQEWKEECCSDSDFAHFLKRKIHQHTGVPHVRQRLLMEEGKSWEQLGRPREVQVVLNQVTHDFDEQLLAAAAAGDGEIVGGLLNRYQDPNCRDERGETAVYKASQAGYLQILQMLLEAGGEKDIADQHGTVPLHVAALRGHLDVVRALIQAGADKDLADQHGAVALHMASLNGEVEVVQLLVEAGDEKDKVGGLGATPLHIAAERGHLEVVRYLVKAGANLHFANLRGAAGIHMAALSGHVEVVRLLVEAKAEKDQRDKHGASPLQLAAERGQEAVVKFLLEAGAKTDQRDQHGSVALHVGALHGHLGVVKGLVEAKADKDLVDQHGAAALHMAALNGEVEIVQFLVSECGADKDQTGGLGATPLTIAGERGHVETVRFLLEARADKDATNLRGAGAIHMAALSGHLDVVRLLVEAGVDRDLVEKNGATALHLAAERGYSAVVTYLLQSQANVDKPDSTGRTSLHLAALYGHLEIVKTVMALCSDADLLDGQDFRPLQLAAENGHTEVVRCFLEAKVDKDRAPRGVTPLHCAARCGHLGVLQLLLELRGDIDKAGVGGATSLHYAANFGHLEIVLKLIEAKARLGATTAQGRSPLLLAASRGHAEVVAALAKARADLEQAAHNNETPLYAAAQAGYGEVVRVLLNDDDSWKGTRPLRAASRCGHMDVDVVGFDMPQVPSALPVVADILLRDDLAWDTPRRMVHLEHFLLVSISAETDIGAPNLMWEHEQLEDGNGNMRHYVVLRASREVTAGEELLLPRARQSPRPRDLPGVALQKALQGAVPALAAAETDFEERRRRPKVPGSLGNAAFRRPRPRSVYARKAFAEGEIVEIAPSILLMESELGRLLADYRYSAERLHAGLFRVVLGCGSIYNHASAPNLAYRRVRVGSCAPSQSLSICYVAERDISAGEELLISYGKTWWSSRGVFDANQKAQLLLPPPSARTAEDQSLQTVDSVDYGGFKLSRDALVEVLQAQCKRYSAFYTACLTLASAFVAAPTEVPRCRSSARFAGGDEAPVDDIVDLRSAGGLALVGAVLGPGVDAIHNQALLSYDVLPVSADLVLGVARTSLLVPPLLAVAYALLGSVLPSLAASILGSRNAENLPLLRGLSPLTRAILAVTSTCLIIKASELLISAGFSGATALPLLMLLAFFQWAVLDGRLFALVLALIAAIGGPLAELPLMWLGAWHYTAPDYWPLAAFGLGPASGAAWAGLSMTTGPCYFAVTTDAIALGRLFASWRREP